jgi:glycosyltransferase involved in cell wall biosynthesis
LNDAALIHLPVVQDHDDIELSFVIPCLNEAETVGACIVKAVHFLESYGVSGEIVVADNGSTDGSQEIARGLGARVVEAPIRGYGAALRVGIGATRGRYVIMGDADDSYDFADPIRFLERLRDGVQLVVGNRFAGGIEPGAMPVLNRYLGNPVLTFIGRLFCKVPLRDFHCGLRGFSRAAILSLDLRTTGMEYASEMIVRAALARLSIAEVPTSLAVGRRSRRSHLRPWRDGWRHLKFLLLFASRWRRISR